jgi:hypothetical protein
LWLGRKARGVQGRGLGGACIEQLLDDDGPSPVTTIRTMMLRREWAGLTCVADAGGVGPVSSGSSAWARSDTPGSPQEVSEGSDPQIHIMYAEPGQWYQKRVIEVKRAVLFVFCGHGVFWLIFAVMMTAGAEHSVRNRINRWHTDMWRLEGICSFAPYFSGKL